MITVSYLQSLILITSVNDYIKTHDSESRAKEMQVVCDKRVSYLHVARTTLNL